jgi:hypothetical protein
MGFSINTVLIIIYILRTPYFIYMRTLYLHFLNSVFIRLFFILLIISNHTLFYLIFMIYILRTLLFIDLRTLYGTN